MVLLFSGVKEKMYIVSQTFVTLNWLAKNVKPYINKVINL